MGGGAFLPSPCTPEKYLLFRRSASPKQMRCCVRRAGEAAPRRPKDAAAFCARNFRKVEVRKETMRISDAASATVAATARPAGSPPDPQTTNTEVLRPPGYRDQDRQGFQSMPSQ